MEQTLATQKQSGANPNLQKNLQLKKSVISNLKSANEIKCKSNFSSSKSLETKIHIKESYQDNLLANLFHNDAS